MVLPAAVEQTAMLELACMDRVGAHLLHIGESSQVFCRRLEMSWPDPTAERERTVARGAKPIHRLSAGRAESGGLAAGLVQLNQCAMPPGLVDLSGLTVVHINRILRQLRARTRRYLCQVAGGA